MEITGDIQETKQEKHSYSHMIAKPSKDNSLITQRVVPRSDNGMSMYMDNTS